MGTANQQDYREKEWFAQTVEPLPFVVQLMDWAALALAGVWIAGCVAIVLAIIVR